LTDEQAAVWSEGHRGWIRQSGGDERLDKTRRQRGRPGRRGCGSTYSCNLSFIGLT
jgi:hypothetical protein